MNGTKYFRKEPSYDAEIVRTTPNLGTTVLEVKDDWANTYVGWIPLACLEGEKPAEVTIHIEDSSGYIEVDNNHCVTSLIICYLPQKTGSLSDALKNLSPMLNFELKKKDGKTYIDSISGIPNSKVLANNDSYKWVVKIHNNEISDNLDDVDVNRCPSLDIYYTHQK